MSRILNRFSYENNSSELLINTSLRFVNQDGYLSAATLSIVSVAIGLVLVVILSVLMRMICRKKMICFHNHMGRKNRSPRLADKADSILADGQRSNETPLMKKEADTTSSYFIQLVDNELIVETQQILPACIESVTEFPSEDTKEPWRLIGGLQQSNKESIGSEEIVNEEICCENVQRLTSFGLTQSLTSCEENDERYSYRNGNQIEYMAGPLGYVDPLFSIHQSRTNYSLGSHCLHNVKRPVYF